MIVYRSNTFNFLSPSFLAKNFDTNLAGTTIDKGNEIKSIHALSDVYNHLATSNPRVLHSVCKRLGVLGPETNYTIARWAFPDFWNNNMSYSVWIYAYISQAATGVSFRVNGSVTQSMQDQVAGYYALVKIPIERTSITDGVITNYADVSITTGYLYTYWFAVTENPIEYIGDSGSQTGVFRVPADKDPICAQDIDEIRLAAEDLITDIRPMLWSFSSLSDTPNASYNNWLNELGIYVDSTTYINLIDQVSTSRSASSSGIWLPAYKAGRGISDSVTLRIYAYMRVFTGTFTGYLRFDGPDHIASNYVELTTTSGTYEWVNGTIELNTEALLTASDSEANKVDIMGKIESGAGNLDCTSICMWLEQ